MNSIDLNKITRDTLAIIMGGGRGGHAGVPVKEERAKSAVPLGGKYRLVDIPSHRRTGKKLSAARWAADLRPSIRKMPSSRLEHLATTQPSDAFRQARLQ